MQLRHPHDRVDELRKWTLGEDDNDTFGRSHTEYGKTEYFRCLLSPDREEAAIFIEINKRIKGTEC